MTEKQTPAGHDIFLGLLALAFALFLYGAVPYFGTPTLGQAVWTTGFSLSFLNESIFSVYATNFGAPEPAAIAFGLAGAWPAATLIKIGLHPADAYSAMAALWLTLAYFSAYKIGQYFGAQRLMAIGGAALWMSMPVIWAHAGYSMLSLGIGLLPFYFWAAMRLFLVLPERPQLCLTCVALYVLASLIAVFMDGYSFVFFAVGASLLTAYVFIAFPSLRSPLMLFSLPVHVLSFCLAYFLYTWYVGKTEFESSPIDVFRGWGVDLSFIAIPTQGVSWVFDSLGLSIARSDTLYFGDTSVWKTTFCLPIVLAGMFGWWRVRQRTELATGFLLLALFAFYMALGPSLKVNSTKPEVMRLEKPGQQSAPMPSDLAVSPTGNSWIYEHLPGFRAMRATYRWSALGVFAFWMVLMLSVGNEQTGRNVVTGALLLVLIGINVPNLSQQWKSHVANRVMFSDIDAELVSSLKKSLRHGETVVFLPFRNDFMINYLASIIGIRTYNIGGDKNLNESRKHWPGALKKFDFGHVGDARAGRIGSLLLNGDADVVVLPYFDTLWAAHLWPCVEEAKDYVPEKTKKDYKEIAGFECPHQWKSKFSPVVQHLKQQTYLAVQDSSLFCTVRLRPEFADRTDRLRLKNEILGTIQYPIPITQTSHNISMLFNDGWHSIEASHVWSSSLSVIDLPVPAICRDKSCSALLKFSVFGASPERRVSVSFTSADRGTSWCDSIVANSTELKQVSVPLDGKLLIRRIIVEVPNATSPALLSGSPDGRILGIALQRIELSVGLE